MRVLTTVHNIADNAYKARLVLKIPKGVLFETSSNSNTMTKTFCLEGKSSTSHGVELIFSATGSKNISAELEIYKSKELVIKTQFNKNIFFYN